MTSVSVSERNAMPSASSSARSSRKFSTMPFCTTTTPPLPSACGMGVALAGLAVGGPAGVADADVALRRAPRPGAAARLLSLPTSRRMAICPSWMTAMPAES